MRQVATLMIALSLGGAGCATSRSQVEGDDALRAVCPAADGFATLNALAAKAAAEKYGARPPGAADYVYDQRFAYSSGHGDIKMFFRYSSREVLDPPYLGVTIDCRRMAVTDVQLVEWFDIDDWFAGR